MSSIDRLVGVGVAVASAPVGGAAGRRARATSVPGAVALAALVALSGCAVPFSERRVAASAESRRLVAQALEPVAEPRPTLTERAEDPIRVRAMIATR